MLCNYRIHYEYKHNYNLIVCAESGNKYHYPHIEADSLHDAIIVVKEFFEDDCAHGLCGNETSYRTGAVITSEEL